MRKLDIAFGVLIIIQLLPYGNCTLLEFVASRHTTLFFGIPLVWIIVTGIYYCKDYLFNKMLLERSKRKPQFYEKHGKSAQETLENLVSIERRTVRMAIIGAPLFLVCWYVGVTYVIPHIDKTCTF